MSLVPSWYVFTVEDNRCQEGKETSQQQKNEELCSLACTTFFKVDLSFVLQFSNFLSGFLMKIGKKGISNFSAGLELFCWFFLRFISEPVSKKILLTSSCIDCLVFNFFIEEPFGTFCSKLEKDLALLWYNMTGLDLSNDTHIIFFGTELGVEQLDSVTRLESTSISYFNSSLTRLDGQLENFQLDSVFNFKTR